MYDPKWRRSKKLDYIGQQLDVLNAKLDALVTGDPADVQALVDVATKLTTADAAVQGASATLTTVPTGV